jgi:hypothetical protein
MSEMKMKNMPIALFSKPYVFDLLLIRRVENEVPKAKVKKDTGALKHIIYIIIAFLIC